AGAPLFGPDGQCVGMLDLTGIDVPERPALKHLVTQSARNIENALTLAQPHRLLLRISWPGAGLGEESDGLLGVDGEGNITAVNRAAANMLALHPGNRWPHASDVFAVPVESLFDLVRIPRPTELPLWSGLRLQVLASSNQKGVEGSRSHAMPGLPLKDVETALIRKAVDDARGNVMEAARTLGISRATVYRKLMRKKKGG
ncbi:MAG: histidine kinase, partial [Comamonadaceae bacterium]|nr:histidine kinase [Comamonadaceae bacterium]